MTAEIAVPEWAPQSGAFARVGDDLVIAGPDGETFSVPGYFIAIPRPLLTTEDGQPLSASALQAALVSSRDVQVAQAFGPPPAGFTPDDGGEDPSAGNFDIVGIGGVQNPGGPPIPSESLERLLTTVAAGGDVEQALQAVFQQAAQEAVALGASPEQALQQYETFANILSGAIAEGINPAQALGEANAVFLNQNLGAPGAGATAQQTVSPEQAMLNSIASGDNAGQLAGSQAFQQALADALQSGAQVGQALDSANVANANVEQALAQTETGTADPLLAALASGENLSAIPAGADFQQALADALANGASPADAIQAAVAATDAVANAQNAVSTGGGDPTLQAIASGDASAIGGSPEMIAALSEALQGGAPVDAAMSVAAQADAAIANAVSQTATGTADPVLQAIASGDAGAISGSPEMIAALSDALQGGAPVDAAMTVAAQTGAAVSNAVTQTTTGTADPVMQMLASGNTAGLGDNPVLIAALNDALANNASPQQAMQQAQQTQEAIANAQQTTNVGGGDLTPTGPAGTTAVAAGAPANTGGPTDGPGGAGAGPSGGANAGAGTVQVTDAANAIASNSGGGTAGGGNPGAGNDVPGAGNVPTGAPAPVGDIALAGGAPPGGAGATGTGSGSGAPKPLPPLPDFGKLNQQNAAPVVNYAPATTTATTTTSTTTQTFVSSTNPGGNVVAADTTPPPVVILPSPVTLVSTPPSQFVREGSAFSLDLSPFFSGDGLNFSVVSGLPSWAELSGTKIQNKSGMTAEGDDAGQSTLVIRVTGAAGQLQTSLTLTVNDVADIETDNATSTTFAPIDGDPVAVDPQVTFDDVDTADFTGAALTIEISYDATNATSADDRLSILNIGTGSGQIGLSGTTVSYGGTTIGTVTQAGAGSTPLIVTLNASASEAAIQALMRAVSYQNVNSNPDLTQAPTLNMALSVGGVVISNSISRPIELVDNLQPQSNDVSFSANEDTTLALGIATFDAQFSDADSGDALQYVRIDTLPSSAFGVLKLDGVAIAAGSSVSRADIVAGKLTFVPATNANDDFGSVSFSFTVSDGKQFAAASDTATISIMAVNDAPNAVIAAASVQYHPDTAATPIAPGINIVEVDAVTSTQTGRFTGGFLDIDITANRSVGDRLSIDNIGTGAGQIGFNGTTVTYGGVTIGTVVTATDGGAGEKLRISLNGNATPDAVQGLARAVTFDNVDGEPGGGARTVSYTVNDGAATGATATATVSISGVGDHFNGSSTVRVFDGNDSISLGNSSDFINGNATTWEAWIKTEQTTGTQTIIGAGQTATGTVINTNFGTSTGLTLSGDAQIYNGQLRLTVNDDLPGIGDGNGGETTATTGSTNIGQTVVGSLDSVGDIDWVRVILTKGMTYQIEIRGGTLNDPDLQGIFNYDGQQLGGVGGDSGGAGNDAVHSFTAPYSGEYYIGVHSNNADDGDRVGSYEVEVTQTGGTNPGGGTAVIAPPSNLVGATNFSATFDLIVNGDGSLADGISFNYGLPGFAGGIAEQGLSTGLSITFDTYSNGAGDTGIEIFFNGSRIGTANTAIDFTSAAGKAVAVSYTDSGLTVTVGGSTVVGNLAIPGYVAASKSAYQYIFGARIGGEDSNQAIDNLVITAENNSSTYNALVVKDGKLAFTEGFRDSVETNTSTTTVADGNWHHVAMSHDGNQTLKLYVDGQLVQTLTGVTKEILAGSGWIGRNSDSATDFFNGEIAEVRVWGDVRDAVEIAANYLPGLASPGTQPDLDSYWNFDGQTGGTIDDSAIGNHDGTVSGATAAERPEFANWRVIEGFTSATDSIVVANGVATITNREILQSVEKHTPTSGNPVHVTGKFNYQNEGDIFTIVTRDNSNTRDSFGSPDGGIHFDINDVNDQNIIQIWGGPVGARVLRGSAQLDLRAGVHYTFDVYDDGTNLRLTVTEVGDPTNSATVIATDSLASQADSYVTIHNRDGSGGNYVLNLEDVRIDDDVVLSEGGSMSGTLSAPSPLTGTLTYSLVDAAGHGTFTLNDAATGSYTYTPTAGYHGRDFITYQVLDASGRSHVETMVFDVVADTDVQVGGAHLEFDGAKDYVQVANAPELQLTTAFTIEAWMRAGDVAHDQLIAGKTDGTNHDFLFKINTAGKLAWFNGTSDTVGSATVDDGQWHHVAVTYENGVVKLYIDGVLDATGTATAPGTSTKAFHMGGDGDTSQVLSGGLDEVRVWDHARSEDDIRLNYDQNAAGSESGLVGYWTFDNVVDGTAKDLSGDGNTAQLGGSRLGDSAQPEVASGGKALAFDGTNDAVNFGSGPSNSFRVTGSMTAEGWFNFAELKTEELIAIAGDVGDGNAAENYLFLMRLNSDGSIQLFHEYGTGSTQVQLSFTPTIPINEWTHLAAVRDATAKTYSLYVDGVLIGTHSYSAQSNPDGGSAASLRLGSVVSAGVPSAEFFHGQMDDIRLWNTARTAAEIAANYQSIMTGSPTGLLAQYTFDDGTLASTLGNNTGTASGGTAFVDAVPTGTQPDINGGAITIAEDTTLSGQMTPDTELSGSVSYSLQTAGDKGGTITVDTATGHWTYTPLDNFYGTETFTLRAAGSTSGTDDETITVTVEQHLVPSVDVSDGHIQFDGVDDRVAVGRGTADSLAIAGDLTIETWVKANAFDHDQAIVEFGALNDSAAENILYNLRLTSGGDIIYDHENGAGVNNSLTFDTNLSADVWHHIAAVRDVAANTVSIYVDGELFGSQTYTNDPTGGGSSNLVVGAQYSSTGSSPTNFLDGALDDLRIWNTARTADEIATNYDRQMSGSEANLQGNWRFDDATGGVVQDTTANNNDGTLAGDPTIAPPLDGVLKFDGTDDLVDTGITALGTSFTIETWFVTGDDPSDGAFKPIASKQSGADNTAAEFNLQVQDTGNLNFFMGNGASGSGNNDIFNLDGGILLARTAYHVAVVFDGETGLAKMFVNGVLVDGGTYSGTRATGTDPIEIGHYDNGSEYWWDGGISDFRMWNVARGDADIAANYANTLTGSQSGLVVNYAMDEIVGGQVVDSAGTNNGTVTGAVVVDADPAVFGTVLTVNENESVSGAMTGNDVAGTPTFGLSGAGAADADGRETITTANGGTVVLDTTSGAWTYTPADKYHGSDSFTLTASGLHGTSDSETVSVTVARVDHDSVDVSDGVLALDGVNDYVDLGTLSGLGATGAITMEAWVDFSSFDSGTAGTGWMRIFDFGQGQGDDNVFLAIDGTTGNIHFASWTGSTSSGFSTLEAIELNEWTHIAAVNNGDGSGAIYINGELVASISSGLAAVTNVVRDENYIGRSTWSIDDYTSAMIDDARVWTVARTAEQIRANYDQQLSGSETGLYANWRFDGDPLADGIYDASGNGHNGVRVNGADIDNDDGGPGIFGTRLTVHNDEDASGKMTANDVMGTPAYSVATAASSGTVTIDASTGAWTYTPAANFVGTATFTLQAAGGGLTDQETVTVAVKSDDNVNVSDGVLQFDGVDDQVSFANGAAALTNHSFTIEFWAMRASNTTQDMVVGNSSTSTTNASLFIGWRGGAESNDTFAVGFFGNDLNYVDPSNTETGVWHHWAVTYDAATNLRILYRDGAEVARDTATADFSGAGDLVLGNALGNRYLNGAVDEVRVWNSARTAEQIYDNHDKSLANQSGLSINYHADSLSHAGATFTGGTIVQAHGGALSFDGVDDVATVASNAALDTAQGTWSIWVNSAGDWGTDNGAPDNATSLMGRHSASQSLNGLNIGMNTAGGIFVNIKDGSGSVAAMTSGSGYADGQWHMVTVTFDQASGSLQKLYVDGVVVAVATAGGSWSFAGQDLLFGNSNDAYWEDFKGKLDDARIYGRELTDQEVADLYRGQSGHISGLLSHWDFNEQTGQTIEDSAGTLDGVLGSGATAQSDDPTRFDADPDVFGTALTIDENESISGTVGDGIEGLSYTVTGAGGADADGRVSATTTHGTITIDTTSGAWTYKPTANYHGTDSFTVTTSDANGNSNSETVAVTVNQDDHVSNRVGSNALHFDGVDDYVSLPANAVHTADMTIETWFKWDGTGANWQRLFDFGASASNPADYMYLTVNAGGSGKLLFSINNDNPTNTEQHLNYALATPVNTWTHVAITIDAANNTGKLYINGELVAINTSMSFDASQLDAFNSMLIGKSNFPTDPLFAGDMSDFRVWTTARSDEQIRDNYDQRITDTPSGLALNYTFDDVANAVVQDATSNNRDGTISGGATTQDPAADVPVHGNAIVINEDETASGQMTANDVVGSATYSVPSQPAADTGSVTIDSSTGAWVYTPPENWSGTATFTVRASGGGITDTETVTVTVKEDAATPDLHQGALQLDGANDYLVAPGINLGGGSFTIELWVNRASAAGADYFVSQGNEGSTDQVLHFGYVSSTAIRFAFWADDLDYVDPSATSGVGEWVHWAASYDAATNMQSLYRNGQLVASRTASGDFVNGDADALEIGRFGFHGNGVNNFGGMMDEVRIWSEARSAVEIQANYDKQVDPTQSNLTAYYRMDALSNGTVQDATGNGHDLTVAASSGGSTGNVLSLDGTNDYVTISVPTTTSGGGSAAAVGSLSLAGANDYVSVPNSVFNNLTSGTIEAWIKAPAAGVSGGLITAKQHDFVNTTAVFGYGQNGGIDAPGGSTQLVFHANNSAGNQFSSSSVPQDGAWHHIAVTFSGTSVQFYIDGQNAGSATASASTNIPDTGGSTSAIGGLFSPSLSGGLGDFDGSIAEVRIWSDVRTAVEIADNHNKRLNGTESDLRAYYRLDDTGATAEELVNGADGTFVSGPTSDANGPSLVPATITIPEINLGATTFTLEAWIKTTATGRTIMSKSETGTWEAGGKDFGLTLDGKLYFDVHGGSGVDMTSTNTVSLADGTWHHVAFTYSSGTGTFYIDGTASGGGALTISADDTDHEIFIGARAGADQYFNGQIDEVRIWSTARSDVQIRDGMAEKYDFDETGLKAQYSFEDGATNSANAYAATTLDGALTNGAITVDSGFGDPIIVYPPATALNFDGTNDTVTFGATIAPTGSAARTFMLWAKSSSSADQTFLSYGSTALGQAVGFGLNGYGGGGQGITIDIYGAAVTFQPLTATNDGQWHHYALVIPTGASLRDLQVYQDGILLSGISVLATGDIGLATSSAANFTLGSWIDGQHDFNGQMSDVSVWSAALTAAQIRDYATNGVAGTESNLTALWRLDEGTGTTVNDVAGAATNGTVNGATWVDGAPDVDGNFLQIVENGSANGRMTAEDVSGAATYSLFDGPDHGTMQLNSVTGEWTYVPNNSYQGTDSFTLRATGATSGIDDELVSIKVGTPPTINPNDSVLELDGSTGHVDVGTLDGLSGDLTIEAWIKWDGAGAVSGGHTWARVVDFGTGQDGDNILLAANGASGELSFDIRQNGATTYSTVKTVADMPLNEWIHVAATTNGSTASLYINGVLQTLQGGGTSGAMVSALDVSRTSSFIGESNWAAESTSDFSVADVRVWNVERTAQQIADNYDRRLNGDETGLYAYWKLDEGSGHVAVDSSGNSHDGAVVGGATYVSQTQISITGGGAYKGLVLGYDGDSDNLSYAIADEGGPDHGTFTFNGGNNTYTYDPTDGYSGNDSVTVDVTDDHGQTTQHTIQFHLA